ncbi:hypothetical protein JYT86_00245 [bacterium AH-315-N03]|nr:hypothetical protein [bacterium AH-315-N03]
MTRCQRWVGLLIFSTACGGQPASRVEEPVHDDPALSLAPAHASFPTDDPMWPSRASSALLHIPWAPGITFQPCEEQRFFQDSDEPAETIVLRYDTQHRLTAREHDATRSTGRLPDSETFCLDSSRFFQGGIDEITYDEAGRLHCISQGPSAQDAVCFVYDADGRVVSWSSESGGHTAQASYSSEGQLDGLQALVDSEQEEQFTFGYEGDRLVRTHHETGRINWETTNDIRYLYDGAGRLVTVEERFVLTNDYGQERQERTRRFEYDEAGRLARCERTCTGCSERADGSVEFRWDGDQLVERRATSDDGTLTGRVLYRYDCAAGEPG